MIDSHCHPNDDLYKGDPERYFLEARAAGVTGFLVVGWDIGSSELAIQIAGKDKDAYAAAGIHPENVKDAEPDDLERLDRLLNEKKVVAVGEIGLDYHWDKDEPLRARQREFFIAQIEMADRHGLPISVHCRDAEEDCLKILRGHRPLHGGVMHCYAGKAEEMKYFIDLGLLIGIGGISTFKNAKEANEAARTVPLSSFLLETDAPYLAPVPYRGRPNHSKYIGAIRDHMASLRGVSSDVIEKAADDNFRRLFLNDKSKEQAP